MQLRDFIELPTLHYNQLIILDDKVIIQAQIPKKTAVCPICNHRSKKVHSFYIRKVRDLSICGKETHIHLKTRRFFCRNQHCKRMIFCEQSSDLIPYKRLSKRALNVLSKILIEVSAHKGSIISRNIGLDLSLSACLRLVHSLSLPSINQVIHLGIDDWALRKGCTYGTALVDMTTGKIIDLLYGRDGVGLHHWLKGQNNILTVNRDRATSYSSVIDKINYQINQIADRFHLVKNLSEHVDAIIHNHSRLINSIIAENNTVYKTNGKYRRNNDRFEQAKLQLSQGYNQGQVGKCLGLSRYTIWKYAQMNTYPIDIRRTNLFDSYLSTIQRELSKGTCLNRIYRLIVEEGYKGARSNFYLNFGDKNLLSPNPFCKTMSMSTISKYMFLENITRIQNKVEKLQMQILCKRIDCFLPLNKLCSSFSKILRSGTKEQLDEWLKKAYSLNLTRLKRFASGIYKDYKAVLNAVLYPSNSGVVEGNINRLKNIKRQMYGRAGLELLKRKVILSVSG